MGRSAKKKHEQRQKGRRGPDRRALGLGHRKWIFRTLLAFVVIGSIAAWQWKGALWAYKKAPSFTMQASTGQLVSLQDYLGKQEVVLIFYMGAG